MEAAIVTIKWSMQKKRVVRVVAVVIKVAPLSLRFIQIVLTRQVLLRESVAVNIDPVKGFGPPKRWFRP